MSSSHMKSSVVAVVALLLCLVAPDVRGQEIVVTLPGTGSPIPEVERFGPSILAQAGGQTLLLDVGRGAHQRLILAAVPAGQIDAVFLTHLHSDHIIGIPDLWLTGWLQSRRNRPWEVFGPSGTLAMMNGLKVAFSVDIKARIEETGGLVPVAGAEINAHEIDPGLAYEHDGVRVSAIRVDTGQLHRRTATGSTTLAGQSFSQETLLSRRISSRYCQMLWIGLVS